MLSTDHLLSLIRNPAIIPFVYDYCDLWCRYCPARSGCLMFRTFEADSPTARAGSDGGRWPSAHVYSHGFQPLHLVLQHTGSPVAQLDVDLSDLNRAPRAPVIGDPIEQLGRHYPLQAGHFIASSGIDFPQDPYRTEATPQNTFVWLHSIIAVKTYRALASAHRCRRGDDLGDDALASARVVISAIDRSRTALQQMIQQDEDVRIPGLLGILERLRAALVRRFPEAATFVRRGLDVRREG